MTKSGTLTNPNSHHRWRRFQTERDPERGCPSRSARDGQMRVGLHSASLGNRTCCGWDSRAPVVAPPAATALQRGESEGESAGWPRRSRTKEGVRGLSSFGFLSTLRSPSIEAMLFVGAIPIFVDHVASMAAAEDGSDFGFPASDFFPA